jgi:hypothetical protein
MLEQPGTNRLATWQLPCPPERIAAGSSVTARRLADHRRAYLTYEGPVSNNRGRVTIHSRGRYAAAARTPDRWEIELVSPAGALRLRLLAGATSDEWIIEICQ